MPDDHSINGSRMACASLGHLHKGKAALAAWGRIV
ncbi:hypothetical protein J2X35_001744 [Mesorhizobium sp. BE184]|nr:hypothetical protein [Mesorhizobium sp. BE184]